MTETELAKILAAGEDSAHRFQRHLEHIDAIARELIALANSGGGTLFVGVDDDGTVEGLSEAEVRDFNRLLDRAAAQEVRPSLMPQTENIVTADGIVVAVHVRVNLKGATAAPYLDRDGRLWKRCGAVNRQITDREELERIYIASSRVVPDQLPIPEARFEDLDEALLEPYFESGAFPEMVPTDVTLVEAFQKHRLEGKGFFVNGCLTVAGALCCAPRVTQWLPGLTIRAMLVPGNDLGKALEVEGSFGRATNVTLPFGVGPKRSEEVQCLSIEGTLDEMLQKAKSFLEKHLYDNHGGVPMEVFDELLVNALVHRNLLIRAPIRLLVFDNRVEIVSPGTLPFGMTVEALLAGAFAWRNPTLANLASKLLPFWGVGYGIRRVLQLWPHVKFENDPVKNEFRAIVLRALEKRENGKALEEMRAPGAGMLNDTLLSAVTPAAGMNPLEAREGGVEGLREMLQTLVTGEMTRSALQEACGFHNRTSFMNAILKPALEAGLLEMTVPGKPQSRNQRYRLTEKAKKRGH